MDGRITPNMWRIRAYPHWASFYWINDISEEVCAQATGRTIRDVIYAYVWLDGYHSKR